MSGRENLKGLITSDDVLGKDVIDIKGRYIGVLSVLHIKKDSKAITGISVDTGFMKPTVYVGINMVMNFGVDAVYISHTPGSRYLGLKVFDNKGIYVGVVRKAEYNKEESENYFVSRILVVMGFKKVWLPVDYVEVIGMNILLNIGSDKVLEIRESMKS